MGMKVLIVGALLKILTAYLAEHQLQTSQSQMKHFRHS